MKAVEGKTPYEAAFGKKPDLSGIRDWGEKVYVRTESWNKLGGRVQMGRWLGVDDESKGVRVVVVRHEGSHRRAEHLF
jgi:hypothetical protein